MTKNSRTINGNSFEEVLTELKKPFEQIGLDFFSNPYIPIHLIEDRLDSALGLNYKFDLYEPPKLIEMDGRNYIVCSGYMEIYDDNGNVVSRRAQSGGTEVIIINDTKEIKDLTSDFKSCVTDCFKKCAKAFGVGRYIDKDKLLASNKLINYTDYRNNKSKYIQKNNINSNKKSEAKLEEFTVIKKAKVDSKRGIVIEVLNSNGKSGELILWNKQKATTPADKLNKLINLQTTSKVKAHVLEKEYHGKLQFSIKEFDI